MQKPAMSDQITHTIRCESEEFSPHRCRLPVAPQRSEIREIRKTKQLSSKPCIEGKSWVADRDGITVSNGCRADFMVVYSLYGRSDRRERWHQSPRYPDRDEGYDQDSRQNDEDPAEIIFRSFDDILNRRPSREEIRFYRNLIVDRGWSEHQIRNDLRNRLRSGHER